MSETLTKLDNLSKTGRASARLVLHGHTDTRVQRRDWEQKSSVVKGAVFLRHSVHALISRHSLGVAT